MGVDTVKLSYDLLRWLDGSTVRNCPRYYDLHSELTSCPGVEELKDGRQGVCNWSLLKHVPSDLKFTLKVVNNGPAVLLWEGSVPKTVGLSGVAHPDMVRVLDRHIRSFEPFKYLPAPNIRRLDATVDLMDPDGRLRSAALGWQPHSRARYVITEHFNPANGGQTVFLHNKSRGIRVYDAFAEHKRAEWARDRSRLEYQLRGDWPMKLGVNRLNRDFDANVAAAVLPLAAELCHLAGVDFDPASLDAWERAPEIERPRSVGEGHGTDEVDCVSR